MDVEKLHSLIVADLLKRRNFARQQVDHSYNKHPGYVSYGIKTPVLRKLIGTYKNQIKGLQNNEAFRLSQMFYKAGIEEQMTVGTYVLKLHIKALNNTNLTLIDDYIGYFKSWGSIDDFCINVMQTLLSDYPKDTILLLRKWNQSQNMWKRRASVVTFTRKVGESGKYTNIVLQFCESLIDDKEDLVRKSVGWALKDVMRGDKKKVLDYVIKLRRRGVPAVITLYALRDIKGKERQRALGK